MMAVVRACWPGAKNSKQQRVEDGQQNKASKGGVYSLAPYALHCAGVKCCYGSACELTSTTPPVDLVPICKWQL